METPQHSLASYAQFGEVSFAVEINDHLQEREVIDLDLEQIYEVAISLGAEPEHLETLDILITSPPGYTSNESSMSKESLGDLAYRVTDGEVVGNRMRVAFQPDNLVDSNNTIAHELQHLADRKGEFVDVARSLRIAGNLIHFADLIDDAATMTMIIAAFSKKQGLKRLWIAGVIANKLLERYSNKNYYNHPDELRARKAGSDFEHREMLLVSKNS